MKHKALEGVSLQGLSCFPGVTQAVASSAWPQHKASTTSQCRRPAQRPRRIALALVLVGPPQRLRTALAAHSDAVALAAAVQRAVASVSHQESGCRPRRAPPERPPLRPSRAAEHGSCTRAPGRVQIRALARARWVGDPMLRGVSPADRARVRRRLSPLRASSVTRAGGPGSPCPSRRSCRDPRPSCPRCSTPFATAT